MPAPYSYKSVVLESFEHQQPSMGAWSVWSRWRRCRDPALPSVTPAQSRTSLRNRRGLNASCHFLAVKKTTQDLKISNELLGESARPSLDQHPLRFPTESPTAPR